MDQEKPKQRSSSFRIRVGLLAIGVALLVVASSGRVHAMRLSALAKSAIRLLTGDITDSQSTAASVAQKLPATPGGPSTFGNGVQLADVHSTYRDVDLTLHESLGDVSIYRSFASNL